MATTTASPGTSSETVTVDFHKYVCEDYASVPGNTDDGDPNDVGQPDDTGNSDATLGAQWPTGDSDPVSTGFPTEGCAPADGWSFDVFTGPAPAAAARRTSRPPAPR
ncbi:MAG: hypothetical protein U5Q44_03005 [Dehalococcoidia bacterium]|nr:hypothetical protein [Dehalococcoidia bacterium]